MGESYKDYKGSRARFFLVFFTGEKLRRQPSVFCLPTVKHRIVDFLASAFIESMEMLSNTIDMSLYTNTHAIFFISSQPSRVVQPFFTFYAWSCVVEFECMKITRISRKITTFAVSAHHYASSGIPRGFFDSLTM